MENHDVVVSDGAADECGHSGFGGIEKVGGKNYNTRSAALYGVARPA
jgi:hypothetical protein